MKTKEHLAVQQKTAAVLKDIPKTLKRAKYEFIVCILFHWWCECVRLRAVVGFILSTLYTVSQNKIPAHKYAVFLWQVWQIQPILIFLSPLHSATNSGRSFYMVANVITKRLRWCVFWLTV